MREGADGLTTPLSDLAELIAGLEVIVWEGDALTYRPTFMSRRAEEMLGYPVAWWLTDPECWRKVIHPEDYERTVEDCAKAVEERRDHVLEYRMITADGAVRWFQDRVRVVCRPDGTPHRVRGVMVDVTDVKQAAAVSAERARLDGALLVARTVAHEVNNALAPVAGFAELMLLAPAVEGDALLTGYASRVRDAALDAAEKIFRLQRIIRLETDPLLMADQQVLDLKRSTEPDGPRAA